MSALLVFQHSESTIMKTAKTKAQVKTNVTPKDLDVISKQTKDQLLADLKAEFGDAADAAKLSAFADKLMAASSAKHGDSLKALEAAGLDVTVNLSEQTLKELGVVREETKWDWKLLGKWIGGGVAVALVTFAGYKLYVKYSKGKQANNPTVPNGTVML